MNVHWRERKRRSTGMSWPLNYNYYRGSSTVYRADLLLCALVKYLLPYQCHLSCKTLKETRTRWSVFETQEMSSDSMRWHSMHLKSKSHFRFDTFNGTFWKIAVNGIDRKNETRWRPIEALKRAQKCEKCAFFQNRFSTLNEKLRKIKAN
jgi:hypothetical protein